MNVVTLGYATFTAQARFLRPVEGIASFRDVVAIADGGLLTANSGPMVLALWHEDGSFQAPLRTQVQVNDAHAITVGEDGSVWVVDRSAHAVRQFSVEGDLLRTLGQPNRPTFGAPFNHPASVSANQDGTILIGDGYGNSLVHKFDSTPRPNMTFGTMPPAVGALTNPHAVLCWADGSFLVADKNRNRILHFDPNGHFIAAIDGFYRPTALSTTSGHLLVLDEGPSLAALNSDLFLVGRCQPVAFKGHGMSIDRDGAILIAEPGRPSGVTRLSPRL